MGRIPEGLAPLGTMVIPMSGRAAWSRAKTTAEIGVWQVALALKVYHSEHGRYPDSLAETADDGWTLPTDPFTGDPVRYRPVGDGFIVYGLGPDMADDNGLLPPWLEPEELSETEEEHRREHYDIPFRCDR
jgi:hypothetical protein